MPLDAGPGRLWARDIERAKQQLEATLTLTRERDDAWSVALVLNCLGLVECTQGNLAAATRRFSEALPRWQAIGSRDNLIDTLSGVATVAAAAGASQWAARLFGAAERQRDELSHVPGMPERAAYAAAEQAARVALGHAAFAAAWTAGRALSLEQALTEVARFLAGAPVGNVPIGEPASAHSSVGMLGGSALTRREREVLHLLCQRLGNPEIAEQPVPQHPHG